MDRIKNLQKARILAPGWIQKQLSELTAIQTSSRKWTSARGCSRWLLLRQEDQLSGGVQSEAWPPVSLSWTAALLLDSLQVSVTELPWQHGQEVCKHLRWCLFPSGVLARTSAMCYPGLPTHSGWKPATNVWRGLSVSLFMGCSGCAAKVKKQISATRVRDQCTIPGCWQQRTGTPGFTYSKRGERVLRIQSLAECGSPRAGGSVLKRDYRCYTSCCSRRTHSSPPCLQGLKYRKLGAYLRVTDGGD